MSPLALLHSPPEQISRWDAVLAHEPRAGLDTSALSDGSLAGVDYARELQLAFEPIRSSLIHFEERFASMLQCDTPEVQPLLNHVANLGGKRLRPALLLLSAGAFEPVNAADPIDLACVVELVHTATLIHDDILDGAEVRRHHATLHSLWDTPAAVLVGDWLFTQAYAVASSGDSTIPGRWVAAAAKAVCEGEMLQDFRGNKKSSQEATRRDYLRAVAGKTAALCAVACSLGAWAGRAGIENCNRLYDFGLRLGLAFQVHDDWLDIFGSANCMGKPLGADVRSGKWTLPVLHALETAVGSDAKRLERLLSAGDAIDLVALSQLLEGLGSSEYTRRYAATLVREACDGLQPLPDSREVGALRKLAVAAVNRGC